MNSEPVSFDISIIGETTGEKWLGVFKAKKRLSYRDQLRRDQLRRELLGDNADNATNLAKSQAHIFSELAVRLVQVPEWWTAADNGLELCDDNVVVAIFEKAMKIETDAAEEVRSKGETAKTELVKDKEKKD